MSRIEALWDINEVEGFRIVETVCEKACRGSGGPFDTEWHQRKDLLRIKQKIQNKQNKQTKTPVLYPPLSVPLASTAANRVRLRLGLDFVAS